MGLNCWEFMKCGREAGSARAQELGVCPAAVHREADGLNGGRHAGRICWAVAGTFCGGKKQGTFAQKEATCLACDFQRLVRSEQGADFRLLMPGQEYKRAT